MVMPKSHVLATKKGDFYLWTNKPYTAYGGLFCTINNEVVKFIDHIAVSDTLFDTSCKHNTIINKRPLFTERIRLFDGKLSYKLTSPQDITLYFDIRKANDYSEWGRVYEIYSKDDITYISFQNQTNNYRYVCALQTDGNIIEHKLFEETIYEYDARRQTNSKRFIYKAITIQGSTFSSGFGATEEDAKHHLRATQRERLFPHEPVKRSMETLITEKGIRAGHPWFFQVWCRDELISMQYLLQEKAYADIKHLFSKYIDETYTTYPAILPFEGNASADAAGWLLFRVNQFLEELVSEGILRTYYSQKELDTIVVHLEILFAHMKEYMQEGLLFSGKDETWMDTSFNDSGREGFCIEIQSLALASAAALYNLTGREEYKGIEQKLAAKVKEQFYYASAHILIDHITKAGEKDTTIRPNIFIVHYVYPHLLTEKEWEGVFDKALKTLWLSWGGLSSIDTKHPLFIGEHTGSQNESYHRGDSWYFLNCMAGIALQKTNPKKYKKYVTRIISACEKDLEEGVLGGIAEISSANRQTSYGCLNQAWSNAMYLELKAMLKSKGK
ncbi:MAG: amylo-alpha-1,6-glucosidase [Candidatus Woesearchaeota archaeon]